MRVLDLFCGAGGAGMGYHRAGFDVVGVDIAPQPHYPFPFVQRDALRFLDDGWAGGFDVVHASPPCQDYSSLKGLAGHKRGMMIDEVRVRLINLGLPWVIENVMGSPLRNPVTLCGSMFGLGVWRHRLFELSHPPLMVPQCQHGLVPEPVDVTGTGGPFVGIRKTPGGGVSRKPKNLQHARAVMGISWMSRRELSEAIPPAYTEWIGQQMRRVLMEPRT